MTYSSRLLQRARLIHPLTILSGLPSAVLGALVTLTLVHKELDLYASVGLIMLFGVVKKNAIMIVGPLLVSQLLALYITPVIYLYMERLQAWLRGRRTAQVLNRRRRTDKGIGIGELRPIFVGKSVGKSAKTAA